MAQVFPRFRSKHGTVSDREAAVRLLSKGQCLLYRYYVENTVMCNCVYDDQGKLIVPNHDLSRMRPRIEIIEADGGNRRSLNLPLGRLLLGDWGRMWTESI